MLGVATALLPGSASHHPVWLQDPSPQPHQQTTHPAHNTAPQEETEMISSSGCSLLPSSHPTQQVGSKILCPPEY